MHKLASRTVIAGVGGWLLGGTAVLAQLPPPPPPPSPGQAVTRDRVPPPRTGTGVIKGRVVDGLTGAPLARARVRLTSGTPRPSVLTDAAGTFTFTQLPPGSYGINADKSTYLSGRVPEAGRTVRSFALPRVLRDGQVMDDVLVRLYHGGAIAGRVLDAQGDAVEYAQVRLLKLPSGGRGRPQMRNSIQTNDLGEFRLGKLEQGAYFLSVLPQRGNVDDPYLVESPPPQPLTTYYPNAPAIEQAQPIAVDRGQTVSGVEIMLAEGSPVFVSGTVIGADGQPLLNGGSVQARNVSRDITGFVETLGGAGFRPDGTFKIQLPPGEYSLDAQASPPPQATTPVAVSGTVRAETMLFGSARVSVGGGNIDGVTITVGRGAILTGRIAFDGTSPLPPNNGDLRIGIFQQDGMGCRSGQPVIAADWTFRVDGLGGTCTASTPGLGGKWFLKSFTSSEEDLLKAPHTFEPGQTLRNVQMVFSDRRTEINVRVADDSGQTTQEYVALIFPVVENGSWSSAAQQVRVLAPRPPEMTALLMSIEGRGGVARNPSMTPMPSQEKIVGLRPNEYYAIAVDDLDNESSRDAYVLERLAASATRVTLGDGATIELPLRRIKFADAMRER